jgi:hypothetical protein
LLGDIKADKKDHRRREDGNAENLHGSRSLSDFWPVRAVR